MSWDISADVALFERALAKLRERVPITDDEYRDLEVAERGNAFWVASLNELAQVRTVLDELAKAQEQGLPLQDFQKNIDAALGKHRLDGAHIRTVLRNAAQTAYSAGRWEQMTSPDVTLTRPYWMFDAVLDDRTTKICGPLDETIKAHDDPFWLTHCPPLHHQCRSGIRTLRRREAERRGMTIGDPDVAPADGFGLAPPLRESAPMLDREEVDDDVLAVFDARQLT